MRGRMSRRVAALLVLLCAAAGHAMETRVEGNRSQSARRILEWSGLPSPLPEWSPAEWQGWAADAGRLVGEAYRERGHFDAAVDVSVQFDSAARAVPARILYRITEGPRYRYGDVRVEFPADEGSLVRLDGLAARPGRRYDRGELFRDRRDILRGLGNAGFLRPQVAESLYIDSVQARVDVVFRVQPGNAFVLDTLRLRVAREGDTTGLAGKTREARLRRLFPLSPGDTLTLGVLSGYERRLKSTRVFNFVRLRDSAAAGPGRAVLTLLAEERVPGEAEVAAYWETQYGFGIDAMLTHSNLRGALQEGRAGLTLAQRKQTLLAGYTAPILFGTDIRFDNELVANWYQDKRLVRDTGWFDGDFDVSNQSKLSRPLAAWARAVAGAELLGKSQRVDTTARLREFNLNFINSLYLQRLDSWVNPARGARLALTWGNGGALDGPFALERDRHDWLEAEAAGYVPLGSRVVLALRLDGGRFFGAGGINAPRFYLGGPRSVRSRDWRSVCPRVNAVGNCLQEGVEPAYVLGSAELRIAPLAGAGGSLSSLQVVPFADYGNVWEPGRALTESGKGRALGIGVRYGFLALFNLRIDYARDPGDAAHSRWVFDLAQAF